MKQLTLVQYVKQRRNRDFPRTLSKVQVAQGRNNIRPFYATGVQEQHAVRGSDVPDYPFSNIPSNFLSDGQSTGRADRSEACEAPGESFQT